ncbi:MAG: OmpA family protein [Flavobacteriales bacterium]|nr:OmpA family protein [Flavobacteriales bacterium]
MKPFALLLLIVLSVFSASAQIDVGGIVKRKAEERATRKIEEGTDKVFDETENGVKGEGKTKKDNSKKGESSEGQPAEGSEKGSAYEKGSTKADALKTYSKFDFVQGEKVLVQDDFNHVAIGDFPADWNTNSGGEIVTVEGKEGKYLLISKEGVFMPDYITDLPENFTLQFDITTNEDFNFYSGGFATTFLSTNNRAKLNDFGRFSSPENAVRFGLHPRNAGSGAGNVNFVNYDAEGKEILKNEVSTQQFWVDGVHSARVSISRQKQRLRIYLNEEKVLDIPRAFSATTKYNAVSFVAAGFHQEQDRFVIGNIKLAVGAPDTRNKLITEGKFVTNGILFDSGSDKIKPESYGVLKEIGTALSENPTVKVKITGHTDTDGEEALNLDLSKRRALSVKAALEKEFAIEASRMETDGKGEVEQVDKNSTPEAKANNRRVEFVKL